MARATLYFPADFRWGTATAAYQVEGQNRNSDWYTWQQQEGRIKQGHTAGPACNWWEDAESDLDLAAEMGTNAHRLAVEWSRIEPEPSIFDRAALERYRAILQAMHDRGIEPMVTLHHFSNPLWLVDKGDFNSDLVVDYFRRFTARVVQELGDLTPKWVTINEPMVYLFYRYLTGTFPAPRRTGWSALREALWNMLRCHAAAYHTIKEAHPDAQVGIAKNVPILEPRPPGGFVDRRWAKLLHQTFNDRPLQALADGRLRWPLGRGNIANLAGTIDFVGVNYYSRYYVHFPPGRDILDSGWGPDAVVSDTGYGEVYPEGLYQAITWALQWNRPIYITENGLPDEADRLRPAFLLRHLREVWRALSFSFPVMGYYHWTLVDNFEWDRGWTQRFGLIALDRATGERRWRPSGRLYQAICRSASINSEMVERYAPEVHPVLFPG